MPFSVDEVKNRARFNIWAEYEPAGHSLTYDPGRLYPHASEEVESLLEQIVESNVMQIQNRIVSKRDEIRQAASKRSDALSLASRALLRCTKFRFDRYKVEGSGKSDTINTTNRECVDGHHVIYSTTEDQALWIKEAEKLFPASGWQMVVITTPDGRRYIVLNAVLKKFVKTFPDYIQKIKDNLRVPYGDRVDATIPPEVINL